MPALGNDRLTANDRICFILSIILRAGDHDFSAIKHQDTRRQPLSFCCQFNSEVEQNLKHNVSAGRSWGEHYVSKSCKKKLKTQSLTCSRAKMEAQAQEEQTIVRKLGKVEQPGAAYERKKREHKKYQRGQKCSCIIFCVLGLFFRSG